MAKFSVNWIMTGTSEIEADDPTKIEDWLNDELAGHGKLAIQGEIHEVRVGDIFPIEPPKAQP